ncbi:MAG: hypothetical protein D6816_06205 [Bacteroidetes bacterium]|nr:MAG: hypothetical protein D6816_06205 [Bacteroidota bacterium]
MRLMKEGVMLKSTASQTEHKKEKMIERRKKPISSDIWSLQPAAYTTTALSDLVNCKGKVVG